MRWKPRGIQPCIPGRKSCNEPIKYNKRRYRRRSPIEIIFDRLKYWRRVATRHDRCPTVFFSAVALLNLRTCGRYDLGTGSVQPYFRSNLWKTFRSTDRTLFTTAVATTVIRTANAALRGESGAGLTWSLGPTVSLYGEADRRFTLDNGQSVTGHSTSASVGVKIAT